MWMTKKSIINPQTIQYQIGTEGKLLSVKEAIKAWQTDANFRKFHQQLLASAPFAAYFWELPPMTITKFDQVFEFVLVDSPSLARVKANGSAFSTQLQTEDPVIVFSNLGGDATLVVPTLKGASSAYPHLAQFTRNAPSSQVDQFWQQVGITYEEKLSERPLWLSTSGLGVYWLHVRLDQRPKYYTYRPYRAYDI